MMSRFSFSLPSPSLSRPQLSPTSSTFNFFPSLFFSFLLLTLTFEFSPFPFLSRLKHHPHPHLSSGLFSTSHSPARLSRSDETPNPKQIRNEYHTMNCEYKVYISFLFLFLLPFPFTFFVFVRLIFCVGFCVYGCVYEYEYGYEYMTYKYFFFRSLFFLN